MLHWYNFFFIFPFFLRKSPIIMNKKRNSSGWFYVEAQTKMISHWSNLLESIMRKNPSKKKPPKNTNIFTQKISLRRFIYWFIFYALFEEEMAYCFVAVCRAVWTIYWLQNIFKCYSVTQNRLCTVYYLKEILMFQLGYLYWGSAPPRATSP